MPRHRIALIGLGMAVTPHAKSLLDLSDRVEVAYAFSPTAVRRKAFSANFSFPLCDSLETIFSDKSVDAVAILSPPNTHLELVRQAAAAGKHVLLEKPVECTTAAAEELVALCERAKVRLGVTLQHRFRPAARKAAALLAAGDLGPIVTCSASIRVWRPQAYYDQPGRGTRARDGGGVLLTQGIHTLDLMLSLAGPVREVAGFATTTPVHRMETEDLACAAMRFANGAIGTLEASTVAYPGFPEGIFIGTERGSLALAGTELAVRYHDGRSFDLKADPNSGGTGADPMAFPHDYHRDLITDFFDALDQGRDPAISGREALRVHRLIDAVLESAARGTAVKVAG